MSLRTLRMPSHRRARVRVFGCVHPVTGWLPAGMLSITPRVSSLAPLLPQAALFQCFVAGAPRAQLCVPYGARLVCVVRPERLYACKPIITYPYRALIVLFYHYAEGPGLG